MTIYIVRAHTCTRWVLSVRYAEVILISRHVIELTYSLLFRNHLTWMCAGIEIQRRRHEEELPEHHQ